MEVIANHDLVVVCAILLGASGFIMAMATIISAIGNKKRDVAICSVWSFFLFFLCAIVSGALQFK